MSSPITRAIPGILSTEQIREAFPALAREHKGFPVAYFDAPGGTQTPRVVVDAVADYLLNHNANTHWEYPTSHETDAIILDARHTFAGFLNASANEIVLIASELGTEVLNPQVKRSVGKPPAPTGNSTEEDPNVKSIALLFSSNFRSGWSEAHFAA